MTSLLAALAAAFLAAMAILRIATWIETSGRMIDGAQAALDGEAWPPPWLTDLDLADDGADAKRTPATEAAQRQSLALSNDEPDPDFIARTRARVMHEVDELAQRRSVTS